MPISNCNCGTDRVRITKLKKIKILQWIWGKGFNWFIFAFLSNEIKQPFAIKTWMRNIKNCIRCSSFVVFSMKLSLGMLRQELHFIYWSPAFYCNHSLLKATFFLFTAEKCIIRHFIVWGKYDKKKWGNYETLLTQMKWVWERWFRSHFSTQNQTIKKGWWWWSKKVGEGVEQTPLR